MYLIFLKKVINPAFPLNLIQGTKTTKLVRQQ